MNSQDTQTPETVNDLDLPLGWIDGRRAGRSTHSALPAPRKAGSHAGFDQEVRRTDQHR